MKPNFAQTTHDKQVCPFCGLYFWPGEIDDHVSVCAPVTIDSVGSLEDIAELEERDGIRCKF